MQTSARLAAAATALALALAAGTSADAACVSKSGEGTGGDKSAATLQAYEAILQATDRGMWSAWMASSQKVGVAPGYQVSNVRSSCKAGSLGQTCHVQATLCK